MTETYNPQIQKIRSIIANAYDYITNLDPISKKVLKFALLVPVGFVGIGYSISLIFEGITALIESGVPDIILERILGGLLCFVGAMAFYESIAIPYRAFMRIFAKPESGEGKITVTVEQ